MTVFAVQDPHRYDKERGGWIPKMNIHNAKGFGDIKTLVPHERVHAALVTQPTLASLRRELKNFGDDDFILPVGDMVLVSMAVAVALDMNRGRAKLLRWSRDRREYDVINLNLYGDK